MSDKKPEMTPPPGSRSANQRRQALKAAGIVAGAGALPMQWKKPMTKAIVLPAHAGLTGIPPICLTCFELTPDNFVFRPECAPEFRSPEFISPAFCDPEPEPI